MGFCCNIPVRAGRGRWRYYDYFYLPGTPLRRMVMDVADEGRGLPRLRRTVIRTSALSGRRPASVLVRANGMILGDSQTDMFGRVLPHPRSHDSRKNRARKCRAQPAGNCGAPGQARSGEVLTRGLVLRRSGLISSGRAISADRHAAL